MAENLFPNCKLPHCSYAHTEYDCYTRAGMQVVENLTGAAFSGEVVTTAQSARTVCFACPLPLLKRSCLLALFQLDCLGINN